MRTIRFHARADKDELFCLRVCAVYVTINSDTIFCCMLELPILLFLTRLSKLELFLHKFTVRLNDFANTHCAQKKRSIFSTKLVFTK